MNRSAVTVFALCSLVCCLSACSKSELSLKTEQRVVVLDWRDFNAPLEEVAFIDPAALAKEKARSPELVGINTDADWIAAVEISELVEAKYNAKRIEALKRFVARVEADPDAQKNPEEQWRIARELGLEYGTISYADAKAELAELNAKQVDDVATVLRRQARRKIARDYLGRKSTPSKEHQNAVNALLVDGWKIQNSTSEKTFLPQSETFDVKYSVTLTLQREVASPAP